MKVIDNADEVLWVLGTEGPLSPAEIAERIGVPRPSVYRLLDGLHAIGLTVPLPDFGAALSVRWLHLADRARAAMWEWSDAKPVLADLVDQTGQTAFLSTLRGREAVCVDWVQGRAIGVLLLKPGRSLPLHAGAAGRVFLAFGADLDDYLGQPDLHRYTQRTLTSPEKLRADASENRKRGYVISDGDVTDGIGALGVPVVNNAGKVTGALSLAGLAADISGQRDTLVKALLAATEKLSATG